MVVIVEPVVWAVGDDGAITNPNGVEALDDGVKPNLKRKPKPMVMRQSMRVKHFYSVYRGTEKLPEIWVDEVSYSAAAALQQAAVGQKGRQGEERSYGSDVSSLPNAPNTLPLEQECADVGDKEAESQAEAGLSNSASADVLASTVDIEPESVYLQSWLTANVLWSVLVTHW